MKDEPVIPSFGKGGVIIPDKSLLIPFFKNPQRADSIIRSITASILAFILILSMIYIAIFSTGEVGHDTVGAVRAAALVVVGFYFGGHVAQNTAQVAEQRQQIAEQRQKDAIISVEGFAAKAEESAIRSEASRKGIDDGRDTSVT